jgi:hypothetical protein
MRTRGAERGQKKVGCTPRKLLLDMVSFEDRTGPHSKERRSLQKLDIVRPTPGTSILARETPLGVHNVFQKLRCTTRNTSVLLMENAQKYKKKLTQ